MNYIKTRKRYMLSNIFNNAIREKKDVLLSVIFNKRIAEYEIYRFESNKYQKSDLNKEEWIEWRYLEDLSWSELYSINQNLIIIAKDEFDNCVKNLRNSYKYKILRNFYNFIF